MEIRPTGPTDELVAQLARLPGLVEAMLLQHVPDEHGRCRACTTGGTGVPKAPWPCGLHWYAHQAAESRRRR